jgi:CheY-like chemotaxis protein
MQADALGNRRILLVEDEVIVALGIEDMLAELGCTVVGPAYSVESGRAIAATEQIDAAVLDINLGGTVSEPIAQLLAERGVPFCFSTGYGSAVVPAEFRDRPVLQKPYTKAQLAAVLLTLES